MKTPMTHSPKAASRLSPFTSPKHWSSLSSFSQTPARIRNFRQSRRWSHRCLRARGRHIAESVTDTEVKLNLPNQKTPKKRTFCIDGVVDIVRENDAVTMYDLKTHDLEFVRDNIDLYR